MNNIQQQIRTWAEKWVSKFNEQKHNFYTQSPLDVIDGEVDTMIVGINPGSEGGEMNEEISVDEFLRGNKHWEERYQADGEAQKDWANFLNGVHAFLGYDRKQNPESIDNDKKTVWTNLTPFDTNREKDLAKSLLSLGAAATLELIEIVKPKRILLLSVDAFKVLDRVKTEGYTIEHKNAFHDKVNIQVGRIDGIPAYSVCHPSGRHHWPINHDFTGHVITFLQKIDVVENGKAKLCIDEVIKLLDNNVDIQNEIKNKRS